ncbi:hypothetical protein [Moraxella lacunata]
MIKIQTLQLGHVITTPVYDADVTRNRFSLVVRRFLAQVLVQARSQV